MTATKVKDVQAKIVDEEFEHGRLEDDNYRKKTCRDTNVCTWSNYSMQYVFLWNLDAQISGILLIH